MFKLRNFESGVRLWH